MKIFVSNIYQKWRETNRDPLVLDAIERFLSRVSTANEMKDVPQSPKPAGKNMSKSVFAVDEFSLGRRSRIYSKCFRMDDGVYAFYLATAGSKSGKSQHTDIVTALSIFENFDNAEWIAWAPSPEQIVASQTQNADPVVAAPAGAVSDTPKPAVTKSKKGKPVGEDGLTVAERKALRKKEQEEQQRQQKLAAQQKRRAAAELAKQQAASSENTVVATVVENVVPVPTPVVTDLTDVTDNALSPVSAVTESAPVADTIAPESNNDTVPAVAPASDKTESETTAAPTVTLNDVPVPAPQPITGDIKFQDVTNIQYELELIEHKMKIERLHVEIARNNIAIAQREIALEELAIKKLQLLQSQKNHNLQK